MEKKIANFECRSKQVEAEMRQKGAFDLSFN